LNFAISLALWKARIFGILPPMVIRKTWFPMHANIVASQQQRGIRMRTCGLFSWKRLPSSLRIRVDWRYFYLFHI
jgi:hypothetical protein